MTFCSFPAAPARVPVNRSTTTLPHLTRCKVLLRSISDKLLSFMKAGTWGSWRKILVRSNCKNAFWLVPLQTPVAGTLHYRAHELCCLVSSFTILRREYCSDIQRHPRHKAIDP